MLIIDNKAKINFNLVSDYIEDVDKLIKRFNFSKRSGSASVYKGNSKFDHYYKFDKK